MPELVSKYFGRRECSAEAVFEFPGGIPAFEEHQQFVFLDQPQTDPLVFMQSMSDPGLCFILMPVFVVDANYRLELPPEELSALGFEPDAAPQIGKELVCLSIVTVAEGEEATANLAAPIVLNSRSRRGLQSMQNRNTYSSRHQLAQQETVPC